MQKDTVCAKTDIFIGKESDSTMKTSDTIKLVVLSDTHGNTYGLREVISMHPNADCYIHLGDGAAEFELLCTSMGLPHIGVKGNCDLCCDLPLSRAVCFGDFNFYLTHGHICQVKFSNTLLKIRGREAGADVILFGHTHTPLLEYCADEEPPFYLVNPGSLSLGSGRGSFALIQIKGKNLLVSHGKV